MTQDTNPTSLEAYCFTEPVQAYLWTPSTDVREASTAPGWFNLALTAGLICYAEANGEIRLLLRNNQRAELVHPGDWVILHGTGALYALNGRRSELTRCPPDAALAWAFTKAEVRGGSFPHISYRIWASETPPRRQVLLQSSESSSIVLLDHGYVRDTPDRRMFIAPSTPWDHLTLEYRTWHGFHHTVRYVRDPTPVAEEATA